MIPRLLVFLSLLSALIMTACASRNSSSTNSPQPTPGSTNENSPDAPLSDLTPGKPRQATASPLPASAEMPAQTPAAALEGIQKKITNLAIADLAARLTLDLKAISLVSIKEINWPDAALGCPQPDMVYAQVITPGFRIKLSAAGTEYVYNASRSAALILCPQDNPGMGGVSPGDTLGGQRP